MPPSPAARLGTNEIRSPLGAGRKAGYTLLCGLALFLLSEARRCEAFVPATGSPYRVGVSPMSVVIADFDADGNPDMAACSGTDSVALLLGDGKGGFGRRRSFFAMTKPHLLVVGDFNRDRKPDVVVSAHDSNEIVALLNDGRGNFGRRLPIRAFPGGEPHNHGLAVGDLNGDGRVDITVGHQGLGRVAVLLGDGHGGFRPASGSPIAVGSAPYPHAVAEVNGDGHLDLVVPDVSGGLIGVFVGDGSGRFSQLPAISTGIARPYFVVARDLNGDGMTDLIVTHDDTDRVAALLGDGRGRFRHAPSSPFGGSLRPWRGDVADLNADGRLDLALAAGRSVRIFDGDGRGGFRFRSSLPTGGESWDAVLADVDGDGRSDVLAPSGTAGGVHVFLTR